MFYLMWIESIAQEIKDGILFVHMNVMINDDYGYPMLVFYGDLFLYIPALLKLVVFR